MKTKFIFLFYFITAGILHVYSQNLSCFSAELGVNTSGIVVRRPEHVSVSGYSREVDVPVISPVLGVWMQCDIGKKCFFRPGLQLLRTGNKSLTEGQYYAYPFENQQPEYSFRSSNSVIMNKVNVPLLFGTRFHIGRAALTAFAGPVAGIYVSAYQQYTYQKTDPSGNLLSSEKYTSVVIGTGSSGLYRRNRVTSGFSGGFSVKLNPQVELMCSASHNRYFLYSQGCIGYGLRTHDVCLSLRYSPFRK